MHPELIRRLGKWSEPRQIVTKRGDRILQTLAMTPELEIFWTNNKQSLRDAGVSRSEFKGKIELAWWQELPANVIEAKKERVAASRAVDADLYIPCPDGLEFRGYQRAGVAFCLESIRKIKGALLADDMGVGKTVQAVGILNADPKIHRVLIVCPNSVKLNWYRELKRWLARPLSVGVADSKCFPTTDVVIINYEICYKFPKSTALYWDLVVLDEAHRVKGRATRTTKSILGFRPTKKEIERGEVAESGIPTRRKLAMTGTPIENKPIEIFPILNWLDPERWKSRASFAKRFCGANQFNRWSDKGASNTDQLQAELRSSIMIRRLKTDPGILDELPEKQRQLVILPADGLERLIKEEREIEDRWRSKVQAVRSQSKLAADYTASVEAMEETTEEMGRGELFRIAHEIGLAKVPLISEHAIETMEDGEKIVLFAHHRDVIDAYMKAFAPFNPVRFVGEDSIVKRQQAVDTFQQDARCRAIVVSEAGKEGITLTAGAIAFFGELWWTPGRMNQMEDRLCRLGQKKSVIVKHFALEGSVDVRKLKVLIEKQGIITSALDERGECEARPAPYAAPQAKPAPKPPIPAPTPKALPPPRQMPPQIVPRGVPARQPSLSVGQLDLW